MINYESLFKVTYGMYIISAGSRTSANGYFSNTFFQITAEPPRFAASCNKNNYSAEFIIQSGYFAVSVLKQETASELIGRFGYRSGKNFNKMEGLKIFYAQNEVPVVLNDSVAWLVCRLTDTIEIGTHYLFIGELTESNIIDNDAEVMTYQYYRMVKKGFSPQNAPTYIDKSKLMSNQPKISRKKYKCTACGYVYDEAVSNTKFSELTEDWVCPVCGAEKTEFIVV